MKSKLPLYSRARYKSHIYCQCMGVSLAMSQRLFLRSQARRAKGPVVWCYWRFFWIEVKDTASRSASPNARVWTAYDKLYASV